MILLVKAEVGRIALEEAAQGNASDWTVLFFVSVVVSVSVNGDGNEIDVVYVCTEVIVILSGWKKIESPTCDLFACTGVSPD